ncbi:MAG: gamma-glutamyltransferase [Firmicutes bacterium]|nr:gamma-glutamyltransferase [Bacillota bacterium]
MTMASYALHPGRTLAMGTAGMVATGHALATAAGLRVLMEGGNAVDAALTAAAVTWVTMPMMCGPGGDAFILIHDARAGRVTAIGGSGPVGARATVDYLRSLGYRKFMPTEGPLSVAVPGAVAAFEEAMRRFGTRGWEEILAPAIRYAEEGHPVHQVTATHFAEHREKLARYPETAAIYLPGNRPPRAGEILRQPDLGRSLRILARKGAEAFYRGELAAAIAQVTEREGLFGAEDLARYWCDVYEPLRIRYREYEIFQFRPPSQGMIHLQAMKIAEGYDLRAMGPSAQAHHLLIEAKKLAVRDRLRYAGDPNFVDVPLDWLLSDEHAAELRREIDPDRARPTPNPYADGETTYLCAVDRDGNAVSLIHSLSNAFGSGVVAPGTGILLNNRAGRGFVIDPDHPNGIAPGKRTMHTLNAYLVHRDGRLYLVGGTPGGDGQPQWNLQVLVALLDWGLDPQQAVEMPRWTHGPSTDPALSDRPEALLLEDRFPPEVVTGLRDRGHPVQVIGPWASGGSAQVIRVNWEQGVLEGGSDPRDDGFAMGF